MVSLQRVLEERVLEGGREGGSRERIEVGEEREGREGGGRESEGSFGLFSFNSCSLVLFHALSLYYSGFLPTAAVVNDAAKH